MDISELKEYLPVPIIISIMLVIIFVYLTGFVIENIEKKIEERKGKEIAFFNYKKIWLSLFWCFISGICLVTGGFIEWKELPFYTFVILGGSSFFYEAFLKKIGVKKDD